MERPVARQQRFAVVSIVTCALLAAGGILGSNMGFKINYPLNKTGTGGSKSGTNTLALPYHRMNGVNDSLGLIISIEGGGPPFSKVIAVAKYLEATDTLQVYTGRHSPGGNFALAPGEGYRVQMSGDLNYIIVGVDDPSLVVQLDAPGAGSKSGTNDYAPPYNVSSATAYDLIKDIEGGSGPPFSRVIAIARFLSVSDALQAYTGRMGSPGANFALTPGESYRIQMSVTVPYLASHY